MKKRFLAMFLTLTVCLGLTIPAFADRELTGTDQQIEYQWKPIKDTYLDECGLFGDSYAVTIVKEADKEITAASILSAWNGEPVQAIDQYAFSNCAKLTSVAIPDTVLAIGGGAFSGSGLSEITIPASVSYMGSRVFVGCRSLTKIEVAAGNPSFCSVDGVLFSKDMKTLISYPAAKPGSSYVIPDTVTAIDVQAFTSSKHLTSITVPASVTHIGNSAFNGFEAGMFEYYSVAHTERPAPNQYTFGLKDVYYAGTEAQWNAVNNENPEDLIAVTMHYGTASAQPQQPDKPAEPDKPSALPTVESIPATGTVYARTQKVNQDGTEVEFRCYAVKDAKGNESNYVRIRDLAMFLDGTKAQFNVGWDGSKISIIPNTAYELMGSEGNMPYSGDQHYKSVSDTPVNFNGNAVKLTSFQITDGTGDRKSVV